MAEEDTKIEQEVSAYDALQNQGDDVSPDKFLLKERFEIDFSEHLLWLDNNSAKAYPVSDRIDSSRRLFALICDNETSPRMSLLPYLKSMENPGLMKLVEYGQVSYYPEKSQNMALIYELPAGGKVFENGISSMDLQNNHEKFRKVSLNLMGIAEAFKGMGITHRAIRPDNLYYKDSERTEIIVGDCAASFPAYHQPPMFETIESLMADRQARGNGTDKNDVYAAGMVLLCLVCGKEIGGDLSAPEILRQKIRKGSFNFVSSLEKIPNFYVTIFKGILNDVAEARWGYNLLFNVLEGKPNNHNSQNISEKAKRALTINGEKVYTASEVVYMMQSCTDEAYELVVQNKITDWIKSSLEDEKLSTKFDTLAKQELASGGNKDLTVARACILLCPDMPVRYKSVVFFPDGIAKAVFLQIKHQQSLDVYVEIFGSDLIKLWYQEQETLRSSANTTEFKLYILRREIGYGIERIIYDIDSDIPCVSSLFGKELVYGPQQVLKALDASFSEQNIAKVPYDRSIIAFLRCRMGKKIDNILSDLNSSREELKAAAIMHLYAMMQNKYGPAKLQNLSAWLINFLKIIIKIYHNKKYQRYLEKELIKIAKTGKLYEIVNLLENEHALEKDRIDYANVLNEVSLLTGEKNKILNHSDKMDEEARNAALRFASILAMVMMTASFAFNLISWVLK